MKEDGAIGDRAAEQAAQELPHLVAYERPRRDTGFHSLDHLAREAKAVAGIESLTASSYVVRSTINPELQRATEAALQEGLARYELNTGRLRSRAPRRISPKRWPSSPPTPRPSEPAWRTALKSARLPLYDVHWTPAIVVEKAGARTTARSSGSASPTAASCRSWPGTPGSGAASSSTTWSTCASREAKGKTPARAELRIRPTVQGAALVLENKTGRILAMAGGFSYPLSQLNRATQAQRQPGSTIKPLIYLAALRKGLQPNTLVLRCADHAAADRRPAPTHARTDYWSPKNYDSGAVGRHDAAPRAGEFEESRRPRSCSTAASSTAPEDSLDRICELAQEAQVYKECVRYYPFVLGAQPVRLIDLAAFYAAIANEGVRPSPHAIESIEQQRAARSTSTRPTLRWRSARPIASRSISSRRCCRACCSAARRARCAHLAPYVAGKTGTTDNENDAWFVGFTNDVTVAVWVGYDNADGKRRTLGRGQTGAKVALPIFEPIMQAAWTFHAPKTALAPPSPEAQRQLVALPIDLASGERLRRRNPRRLRGAFPPRRFRPPGRHAVPIGAARGGLCVSRRRSGRRRGAVRRLVARGRQPAVRALSLLARSAASGSAVGRRVRTAALVERRRARRAAPDRSGLFLGRSPLHPMKSTK